jgi:inner membrane protein
MDNLTHSLVGALLAQAGLKRKTALAMPTLIIAANLPDIDAACFFWLDGAEHLGFRRGITHGPVALLLLPVLLWAAMLAWDAWRRGSYPDRPALHKGWLLALAYIGTLSHPALDWLNVYGVRLLEPFSSRWFYGDSIFIIDVWLWAGLIGAIWASRRMERNGQAQWTRPAGIAIIVTSLYVFANGLFTGWAEARVTAALQKDGIARPMVVASPPPLEFWRREIYWRDAQHFGETQVALFSPVVVPQVAALHQASDPRIAAAALTNSEVAAFLLWSRMPVARFAADGTLTLTDQRFRDPRASARFTVIATTGK